MDELASTAGGPAPDPSRAGAIAGAILKVALALPFFGCAWLAAAAVGLVCAGARAGWRDAREFSEPHGSE